MKKNNLFLLSFIVVIVSVIFIGQTINFFTTFVEEDSIDHREIEEITNSVKLDIIDIDEGVSKCDKFYGKEREVCLYRLGSSYSEKHREEILESVGKCRELEEPMRRGCSARVGNILANELDDYKQVGEKCESMESRSYIYACLHGVGNYMAQEYGNNTSLAFKNCKKAGKECFHGLGRNIFVNIGFEKSVELCNGIINDKYKGICFRGISHGLGDIHVDNVEKAISKCNEMDEEYRDMCKEQVIHHLGEIFMNNLSFAIDNCMSFSDDLRESCFRSLGEHAVDKYRMDEFKIDDIDNLVPKEYLDNFSSGFKDFNKTFN